MNRPNHPPTRANVAAKSGEWVALYDCYECANGVYLAGVCSCCGAPAPRHIAELSAKMAAKQNVA